MTVSVPNPEQSAAIDAPGVVFVSAGAGTGKTTVLVERFVKAVCERGLDVDSVLVITYTERAAGELRGRIRARLAEAGRVELARELDAAWISTIHGFCHRLLKAHPFAAGIDPRFRVLDEAQARVLQREAFEAALTEFCADGALTGFANFAPQFCVDLYNAVKAGDLDRARRLHEINWALEAAVYKAPNVYKHSRYKVAAYFTGLLDNMIVRAPQLPVPEGEVKLIHDAMEKLAMLKR